jgi:PAS domain S-box-containing protein
MKVEHKQDPSLQVAGIAPAMDTDVERLKEQNRFLEDARQAIANILEDIAESEANLRKKTEELEKFQQIADTSFDQIIITDPDGVVLYANHATEVLTGYSRAEVLGQKPSLWGSQMPEEFYQKLWKTIKDEKLQYAGEVTNQKKSGEKYLASTRITPLLDPKGEVRFFVAIQRDITEERKAQARIVRHAAELESANAHIEVEKERAESILGFLKSIGEGVFATDIEGKIIFMNEAAELMTGTTFAEAEQHLSKDIVRFVEETASEGRQMPLAEQVLEKQRAKTFSNKMFVLRGEKHIPVSGTCSLIRDTNENIIGTITVFQDVTKKHELDQMKDSFLSVAAHQLRTPLGSMRWSMELLLSGDLGDLPADAKEAVGQLYENSQRMVMLVNDLLDVSRIDQNKGKEEKKTVDVISVIRDAVAAMAAEAKKRSVKVEISIPEESVPGIMAPPKRLYEAFENLVSNGIKYNRKDGRLDIVVEKSEKDITVKIIDTGIGIPKGDQSKIFSKFFRASNAVLKETEGSGLGLSVVKSYLEEADARISFESAEGVGTTFLIRFPFNPLDS